jgi:DNA invertase Pin-like site-specific DNA recombinase
MSEGLAAHGVRLASVGDGAHLAPADVRSVALALAGVVRYEAEVRVVGPAAARERGVKSGRPSGPGKRLKVTAEQEEIIRRLKAEGKKITAIARATDLSRPTVYSALVRGMTSATTCASAHRVPVPPGPARSRSAAGGPR